MTALMMRTVSPEQFRSRCVTLTIGDSISRDGLILMLRSIGYIREDPVSDVGEFSFRGGIVDVYSPSYETPVRIEFFGDEVESIRKFDPATQRSVGLIRDCEIVPMREMCPSPEQVEEWHRTAPEHWNEIRFAEQLSEMRQFTENGELFNGFEFLFPLVSPLTSGILDFLHSKGGAPRLILNEPDELESIVKQVWTRARESHQDCDLEGTLSLSPESFYFTADELKQVLDPLRPYRVEELATHGDTTQRFDFRPILPFKGKVQDVLEEVERARRASRHVVFVMRSKGMMERLAEIFREYEVGIAEVPRGFHASLANPLAVTTGRLVAGFSSQELGLHVITEPEVFGKAEESRRTEGRRLSDQVGAFISDFRDLHDGDFVVHLDHGIGVFRGLKQIGVGAQTGEFVILEYAGGGRLYVPVDRLDLIQKYSSAGGARPHVDRLGGTSWKKTKARIKKSMQDLAEDLLKLYAKREVSEGYAYAPDDELAREFEATFEYQETPDQAAAISSCKKDMESKRPMDRLICGDVGYGKTEVAMRAAFKAVNDGKQVAVLTPTTVLAFQHFGTFRERFKGFPVRIEMLSRFLGRQEQKEVVEKVELGMADILIGTHRLLSRDVKFNDLGLIIVDEEQRFGVAQKERLKKLKAHVDVLTLSATPIPRTLNMSLVGIRDLSIIETAPKDRIAIQTVVVKFSSQIIRSAIDLELKRSGQVFFLHNSVETINSMAQTIHRFVPEARVAVAHGQMAEEDLEKVMLDFLNHKSDVLVCTTIIENGLDIPRANTIIVNRADRFGLSQLYQLRGRVGRSNRRAYAYLLVSDEDRLTEDARKRLAAIKEFSDLGSGFRLAALDLEIRGAGNLLGGEQSGHIEAVGFELYMKLLEQTISELKGESTGEELRTSVDLRMDIQIPEYYIEDSNTRLWLYKRLSQINDEARLKSLREETLDRFGKYPKAVANLFEYARLRIFAQSLKLTAIERKGDKLRFKFREDTPVSPDTVIRLVGGDSSLNFSTDGALVASIDGAVPSALFERAFGILSALTDEQ